jgi:hypothetical protein
MFSVNIASIDKAPSIIPSLHIKQAKKATFLLRVRNATGDEGMIEVNI